MKISFIWASFFFFTEFGLKGWASPSLVTGKSLYANQCAECHGERGQGVEDEYSKPLVGDWPLEKIIRYVDKTMPDYDPKLTKGKNAELVSKFIFESFYQKLGSGLPRVGQHNLNPPTFGPACVSKKHARAKREGPPAPSPRQWVVRQKRNSQGERVT